MNLAHFMTNLKAIFALPKWEKDLWRMYSAPHIDLDEFKQKTELIYKNAQFRLFKVVKH